MVRPTMRPSSSIPTDTTSKPSAISRSRETGCASLGRIILIKQDRQQTVIRRFFDMPLHDGKTVGDFEGNASGHGRDDEGALCCVGIRLTGNEGCTGCLRAPPGRIVVISKAIPETFERLLAVST